MNDVKHFLPENGVASIIGTIGLTVAPIILVAELACWFAVVTLKDAFVRRQVTHASEDWRNEVLWMSLYFSAGVWVGLVIVFV